jgi:hypothetical protein
MDAFEETSSEIGRTPISDLLGLAATGHCVIRAVMREGVLRPSRIMPLPMQTRPNPRDTPDPFQNDHHRQG